MNVRVTRQRAVAFAAGLATVGLFAAGCADDPSGAAELGGPEASASQPGPNEPSATPAPDLPGAVESPFVLLDTRPPGTGAVEGTAWLAQGEHGTTLTVTMTGLEPGSQYVGHLHAKACADDNGGPHFKFDPNGSDEPPNEVHLGFTADDDGEGTATVTNAREVGDAARSVVIHPAEAQEERLACADF